MLSFFEQPTEPIFWGTVIASGLLFLIVLPISIFFLAWRWKPVKSFILQKSDKTSSSPFFENSSDMTTLGSYVPESVTTSLLSQSVDLKYDYRTKQLMNEAQPNSSEEVQVEQVVDELEDKPLERLSYNDIAEIDPSRLQIDESQVIGGGCFGLVIKGFLDGEAVAVKVASKGRNGSAWYRMTRELLYQEICLLSLMFQHENILNFKGAITENWEKGKSLLMIMELCDDNLYEIVTKTKEDDLFVDELILGDAQLDARGYQVDNKTSYKFEIDGSITITKDPQLSTSDLLSFAYQTAKGMQFLSSKQYVHRDLATRNLLVKKCESEWIVKICDFGLAKEIREAKSHYSRNGFAQPLNWMSPEAYAHKKYTSAADVWSFGIGLYELFSLGGTPYGNKTEQEIQKELSTEKEKLTTKRPPYCHQELFNFIECFWYYDASRRPSFENCVNELKSHLQRANPQKLKRLDGIND